MVRNHCGTHQVPSVHPFVFVLFCLHMYSFACLIRWMPPPTFSDTAITDRHYDTTIFQLRAHWVRISWSIDQKNRSDMCPRWELNPKLPACKASTLSTRPGSPYIGNKWFTTLYVLNNTPDCKMQCPQAFVIYTVKLKTYPYLESNDPRPPYLL